MTFPRHFGENCLNCAQWSLLPLLGLDADDLDSEPVSLKLGDADGKIDVYDACKSEKNEPKYVLDKEYIDVFEWYNKHMVFHSNYKQT